MKAHVAALFTRYGNLKAIDMPIIYEKVALIGLGLIASSMFWGMKRAGLVGSVSGFARSAETRA